MRRAPADSYLLGLDIGTTTCRAAVFDLAGHEIAGAFREISVDYPRPSWAELDPEVWWHQAVAVIREAVAGAAVPPERIVAAGVCALMHAPVLIDEAGRPRCPSPLWMDQRCTLECAAMERESGLRFATTLTAPKLRWLADHEPATLIGTRWVLLPKDFIRFRLTGAAATDPSDASGTGMYDAVGQRWDSRIVGLTRIRPVLLPPIHPSSAFAGGVTPAAAALTGLLPGTPVAVGGGDAFCAGVGSGPLGDGEVCLYLGTAAWIAFASGGIAPRVTGTTATTGGALRWARDLLTPPVAVAPHGAPPHGAPGRLPATTYAALTAGAGAIAPGAEGLFCLPHLMGERGPQPDPLARGALVGLTLRHGRDHVVRAVLEGTAFHLRRLLDARAGERPGVRPGERVGDSGAVAPVGGRPGPTSGVVCGGAARSALWMQLLADVTRIHLRTPEVVEAGALGAAILGGAAVGVLDLERAPATMVRVAHRYHPDDGAAVTYDALYERYSALDDLLAPWFREATAPPVAPGDRPSAAPRSAAVGPAGPSGPVGPRSPGSRAGPEGPGRRDHPRSPGGR